MIFLGFNLSRILKILCFNVVNCDLAGAELYANDVYLGDLPLKIEQTEFLKKVPLWSEVPEELPLSDLTDEMLEYDSTSGYGFRVDSLYSDISLFESEFREQKYYVRIKYHGQWCYAMLHSGGSGGGGGPYYREYRYNLRFLCLERERQIETLLDQACLQDYQVPDTWFEAMDRLGRDGILALLKAESHESGASELLDQWAAYRYALDRVKDEKTAWRAFKVLCGSVEECQAYSTEGLEGRAVTWLAPRLPIVKLTRLALRLIDKTDLISWTQWRAHGRIQFGYSYDEARFLSTEDGMSYQRGGVSANQCPIEAYAVAHALEVKFRSSDPKAVAALQDDR